MEVQSPGRLSTLGRATVYFYTRGNPALTACLVGRLNEGRSLRDVARLHRVDRQVVAVRTEEYIRLMRVFCEEYGVAMEEMVGG